MRILVTGGAGYIGTIVCERLLRAGHAVRVLDRLYWGRAPLGGLLDRIELVHADVRSIDESVFDGIDGVVHLAGLSNDPTAEYNREANWEMNATATEALARAKEEQAQDEVLLGRALDADAREGELARYERGLERSLYRALDELRQLQDRRRNRPSRPISDAITLVRGDTG